MTISRLDRALEDYAAKLTALEEAAEQLSPEQALDVLIARHAVHTSLTDKTRDPTHSLITLVQLDSRLRKQADSIAQAVELADWRASLNPPEGAWWWFFETPRHPHWSDRLDWLWSVLAVLCLTASLSLMIDISWRFLSEGPDALGAFAVVAQGLLTMVAAGGALTGAGRKGVERILQGLNIPRRSWQVVRVGLAMVLLLGLLGFRLSLPQIAVSYNNRGLQNYLSGRLDSAQFDYSRALKLNPDYVEAHYNLGLLYEDLQDFDRARAEYQIAVQGGLDAAYNNLARLHILGEDYSASVSLLLTGLELAQEDQVKCDMLKNLGWARLGQARYSEAEIYLRAAIELATDEAPAHCLLAQVLDGLGDATGALLEWENCLRFADARNADEDAWIGLARQRIEMEGEER
jgi:tetratricopeptide (TPR) repeat protein